MAGIDDEFVVVRSRLPRVTPFPTWDGVLACSTDAALSSLLCESGQVIVLTSPPPSEPALQIHQILDPDTPQGTNMTMCQAWTRSGLSLVVARDRCLTVYRLGSDGRLSVASRTSLRFAATTVDVVEDDDSQELLLAVGSVAGLTTYSVSGDSINRLASQMDEVSVSIVKFSGDGCFLAVGTIDGRIMVLRRSGQSLSDTTSDQSFTKVLAAPRVTSITFSPSSDTIVVSTRKGNVYVLSKSESSSPAQWELDDRFEALAANPKGGAASQTLSCWWGSLPVFVIAGRAASNRLELYDVRSRTLLQSLDFSSIGDAGHDLTARPSDRHLMGVVCLPPVSPSDASELLCIDNDATVSKVAWPFLEHACPPL